MHTLAQSNKLDLVYICDWLPPDFGAVGQYGLLFAREMAARGQHIVLIGLSSRAASEETHAIGSGSLTIRKLQMPSYDKTRRGQRLLWTIRANTQLLRAAWPAMRRASSVLFTGSPPLFLHWIVPANLLLRRKLVYRITDFHPECAIAERGRPSVLLRLIYTMTIFWRRRVHEFEVLGNDQAERLRQIGIPAYRIRLKRDPSPIAIAPDTPPLARPAEFEGKHLLLYSGNWGMAHDAQTFLDGYAEHHRRGDGRVVLWLNAVGAKADGVETALREAGLPFFRSRPAPLEQLGRLLVTADSHLITLSDAFVGYVLPSKVYGCIASRKPIVFIGSERSDVHHMCVESSNPYYRMAMGDAAELARVLDRLADDRSAACAGNSAGTAGPE